MRKPTITHRYPPRYVFEWLLFILGVILLTALVWSTAGASEQMFDHGKCQYPSRTTNPSDGCDNTDPCDPQDAAKGGSGECTKVSESQQQPTSQNIKTGDKPVERVHNSCAQ